MKSGIYLIKNIKNNKCYVGQSKNVYNRIKEHKYLALSKYCDSWSEMLCDKLYQQYVIVGEEVYKVIEKNHRGIDEDIFEAYDNGDGTINYEVMYYDGGCSFDEAIEEALENMK